MISSHRAQVGYRLLAFQLVAVLLPGLMSASGQGPMRPNAQKGPWSVYTWSVGDANDYFPPSCHNLSYFSQSPLHFDRNGTLAKWPPGSFKVQTQTISLGAMEHHRVYQVLQDIVPDPEKAPEGAGEYGMKRILVERRPNEFCMIFEEAGAIGPYADIIEIKPAELDSVDGERVLLTHDQIPGNGGYTLDGAWVIENGVPVSLLEPLGRSISQALGNILPPGCGLQPNHNPLDLEDLMLSMAVSPSDDSGETSTCGGYVTLKLGMRNHRLVVVDKRYVPHN